MKVTYFKDTDTAVVELIDAPDSGTRELNENVYLDVDEDCNFLRAEEQAESLPAVGEGRRVGGVH